MVNTLVHDKPVSKGSQWAVLNASDEQGPLRTIVNKPISYKRV